MFYEPTPLSMIGELIFTIIGAIVVLYLNMLYWRWIIVKALEKFVEKHPEILRRY